MAELIFVGRSDDNLNLIFTDDEGNEFRTPIDDRIVNSINANSPVIDIRTGALGVSPRDIQARLRRGETIANIAHEAGESSDRIERYAGPVFAERHHMASRARQAMLRRPQGDIALESIVEQVLLKHNVDTGELEWDSYRREDSRWNVTLSWPSGDGSGFAVWIYDPLSQTIVALDDQARWIFDDGNAVHRTVVAESRPKLVSLPKDDLPAGRHIASVKSFDPDSETDDLPVTGDDLEYDELDSPAWAGPGQPTIPVYLPSDAPEDINSSASQDDTPSWDEILFGSRPNDY